MATKATSEIQRLTCDDLENVGPSLASYEEYRHQSGTEEPKSHVYQGKMDCVEWMA